MNSAFVVTIPAYNEEATIEEVVLKAKNYADVCVIDDCSTDRTPEILGRIDDIKVIRHERNTHIAGALLDGMKYSLENGYDYMIAMDAGMSHNPDEIPRFIDHPPCDLVIGTRVSKPNTPLHRKVLSVTGNFVFNRCLDSPKSLFHRQYYHDITSGFRRYSCQAMELVLSRNIRSKSADILLETVVLIHKNRLSISEVPITYRFSNSYCNYGVIKDCLELSLKSIFRPYN